MEAQTESADGRVKGWDERSYNRAASRVIPAQVVRPLGFEPRTCGLRVSSKLSLTVSDRPSQARYQGLQSLSVADRPRLSRP
jgi:hypothetical protein